MTNASQEAETGEITMCDERERLIEYLYGEVDDANRRRIEAHLVECHDCRAEVGGLRSLRDDLLAWDVPRHEPIWRPVAPQPVPLWRRMPAWGLAAAASLIFAAGAAGGMATRMWVPTDRAAASAAQADAQAPTTNVPAAVTAEDLAQLEASILQRVRMEVEEQLRTVSVPSQSLPVTLASSARIGDEDLESLLDRIAAIEQWKDDQITLNAIFNGQFGRLNSRTNSLTQQVELSRMQRAAFEAGAR